MFNGKRFPNCPVNIYDIMVAEEILGPGLVSLKGKTNRRTSPTLTVTWLAIPTKIK